MIARMTTGTRQGTLMDDVWSELSEVARRAAKASYSPYSKFRVGAALLANGRVFSGCNVENASFGLTLCAERVAAFAAVAAGATGFEMMAISCPDVTFDSPPELRMSCGACRQVLAEFSEPSFPILIEGVGLFSLGDLLPHPFELSRADHT